jgi:hypothetical protein
LALLALTFLALLRAPLDATAFRLREADFLRVDFLLFEVTIRFSWVGWNELTKPSVFQSRQGCGWPDLYVIDSQKISAPVVTVVDS